MGRGLAVGTRGPALRRRIVEAHGCTGSLDDADALLEAMREGAVRAGAEPRQGTREPFLPHGVTCVLVLAESHVVVSTWPEHRFAAIDACVCGAGVDLEALAAPVLALLAPAEVARASVDRPEPPLQRAAARQARGVHP